MRRVLARAVAVVLLLGVSSADAYERSELVPSDPLSPGGDPASGDGCRRAGLRADALDAQSAPPVAASEIAAVEQVSAPDPLEASSSPPVVPNEPVAGRSAASARCHAVPEGDLATQRLTVREGDRVLHVWPISSGRRGYATPTGTFRPAWMARMWRSRQYDDAPMPHSIFFNSGIAFHATSAVSMLGRPASHGCLRLAPAHAAELFALVRRHGLVQTKVVVEGAAPFPPVAVARADARSAQAQGGSGHPGGSSSLRHNGCSCSRQLVQGQSPQGGCAGTGLQAKLASVDLWRERRMALPYYAEMRTVSLPPHRPQVSMYA